MKSIQVFVLFLGLGILHGANNTLTFDGTADYIAANGVATNLAGSSTLTMEAWFNSANVSSVNDQMILAVNNSDGSSNISQLYIETGASTLKYTGSSSLAGLTTLSSNTWYHVALTLDASNNLKVYLNGNVEISTTETDRPDSGDLFSIGQEWDNSTASNYFDGKIDEVRIWNDVRTETEIRQNMYRELPDPASETNLVAYYKFNETSGTTLSDSKGSNTGTLTNMAGNEWQASPAMFGPKNALDFDGTDDFVNCGTINLSSSPITLECWVNTDVFQSVSPFISSIIGTETESDAALLRFGDGGLAPNKVQFVLQIGASQTKLDGATELAVNTWYHLAGVYDGSKMKIYINGKLDISKDQTGDITSDAAFNIASNSGSERFLDGSMDEVRVWLTARTASEIRENMCKTLTGNETGLVAYYNFDNTAGTTLQNIASNSYDGTLLGSMTDADWVVSSAFNTWLNTSSSSWSTTTNWSRGNTPGSSDNVGVYSYSGGSEPALPGSTYVKILYLASSTSLTLNDAITIMDALILDADLDLNGQQININNDATLYEYTGRVYGSSGKLHHNPNLSSALSSENIAGLGAEITTGSALGVTTIDRGHAAQSGNGNQSILRYYDITPTTNTGLDATLVFYYNDSELNGLTESNLVLYKSTDSGSTWTNMGGTVDVDANTVTLIGIDSFSRWTLGGTSDQSLPVELTDFGAEYQSNGVLLSWRTASETENLGFIIQRKTNHEWLEIASYASNKSLEGQGSTSEATDYIYRDTKVQGGVAYEYRLGDVDYRGTLTWHDPKQLTIMIKDPVVPSEFGLQKAYPNPFNPSTTIRYGLPEESNVSLVIYDLRGNLIQTMRSEHQSAGWYDVVWNGETPDGTTLCTGIYFARLVAGEYTQVIKMLYLK